MERFHRGVRNLFDGQTPNLQTLYPPYTTYESYCQTLYAWFGHYIASSMHCQAHLCQTFVSILFEFAQKIKKTFIKIYKGLINQEKRFETGKELVLRNLCFFIGVYGIHLIEVR